MISSAVSRAIAAAKAVASSQGLAADHARVLQNSNKLALRLLPADVMARVAPVAEQCAQLEVDLAERLAAASCPIAVLDPRVEPRVYQHDGFVVTFWTHYSDATGSIAAQEYADALRRLHAGMRAIDHPTPHFTDRVEEAQQLVATPGRTPDLPDDERALLADTLAAMRREITAYGHDQLLHGEPHPGNLLNTGGGPRFIDLETCCRGPVEFDLAHAPEEVADHYPGIDHDVLAACRILMLAMIVTWRWDAGDQLPDGRRLGAEWLAQLRTLLELRSTSRPHRGMWNDGLRQT